MIFTENVFFSAILCLIITLLCSYYFKKKNILLDEINYSKHKKLNFNNSYKPPLCGGVIVYISSLIFFSNGLILLKIFGLVILTIGIFSDINKISSPKIRILLQILPLLLFVIFNDLRITDLRIGLFNELLDIKYVSIIFTVFCLLILLNGSNFLDGLNTLVIGYYILVSAILILISSKFDLVINQNIFYFFIFLIIIFLFNYFGKIYLGDSGSYLISFFAAFFILDFLINNVRVSPYLVCLLLWYPAFENLFTILRRILFSKKIHKADQRHLHQMIFKFFLKKKLINEKYLNTFTGNIINFFNFTIFILFYKYYLFTKFLAIAILFNLFVYLICYLYIKKKLNHF